MENIVMSPRYNRLMGSLARVDCDLAADIDQGTTNTMTSSPQVRDRRSFEVVRRKPALPKQTPRQRPASDAPATAVLPSQLQQRQQQQPAVLQQLEKAKSLRNLDDAKQRHARLAESLSRLEEQVRSAVHEVERSPRSARQRIRDRRQDQSPSDSLTPRQRKLISQSSRDIPPGTYATTAVCFKCGHMGHKGGECLKPTLGPKHLRTTQVMLQQRKVPEPLPPGSKVPLHVAKSPRQPRLRHAAQTLDIAPDTPPNIPVEREEIQQEIERLKVQLDRMIERETMYETVEQLQSSLGTLRLDRTAPTIQQAHDNKWQVPLHADVYEELSEQREGADGEHEPRTGHSESVMPLTETSMRKNAQNKANSQRHNSPQRYNRTALGKSQPLELQLTDFEHLYATQNHPDLRTLKDPTVVAVEQAGFEHLRADIEARLKRLKTAMAFPNMPKSRQWEHKTEPEPEPEPEPPSHRIQQTKDAGDVRELVKAVFRQPGPLGLQLGLTDADCIVILAIDDNCGVNAPVLIGLRVGHELLRINGQSVESWNFDDVIAQLVAFTPQPGKPLVLEFGLTGLHRLRLQPKLPGQHESYRGALDEQNEYDVVGKHGDAGLSYELGADVRAAELQVTIDALSSTTTPAPNALSKHRAFAEAKSEEHTQHRQEMCSGSESDCHEDQFTRPHYFKMHLPGTHRPPQPIASATHVHLGSWAEEAAEKAILRQNQTTAEVVHPPNGRNNRACSEEAVAATTVPSTAAEKRQLAAASGKKTFRQYDPTVEGGVGFAGLLDVEDETGPGRAFNIPAAEEKEEDRWRMPERSKRPVLKFPSKARMSELWKQNDYNGNGLLSQSEAKQVLSELWPKLTKNSRVCDLVLRLAYMASDDGNGDGLVDRNEFPMMLEFVQYFNRLYGAFSTADANGSTIDVDDFVQGCKAVGLDISREDAEKELGLVDKDKGYVAYLEVCAWTPNNLWHRAKIVTKVANAGNKQDRQETSLTSFANVVAVARKIRKAGTGRLSKGKKAVQQVLLQKAGRQQHSVCWNCGHCGHVRADCPQPETHVHGVEGLEIRQLCANKQQDVFAKAVALDCDSMRSLAGEGSATPDSADIDEWPVQS